MIWHIGNTTVRNPYRLRSAIIALSASNLNGNLLGRDNETAFARLLHDEGILIADRISKGEDISDLGRKWRVALSQLGFISPSTSILSKIHNLTEQAFAVTANGHQLAESESINAQQECFLRSLAAYIRPSILEPMEDVAPFSPLRYVIQLILSLEAKGSQPAISFPEMASIVQASASSIGVDLVADQIIEYRGKRDKASNKKKFDQQARKDAAGALVPNTLTDYADVNIRYLKATGIFVASGRGIAIAASKRQLARYLAEESLRSLSDVEYLQQLWQGARLPVDDAANAISIIQDLTTRLNSRGHAVVEQDMVGLSIQQLSSIRYDLEKQLREIDEEQYAEQQVGCFDEIAAWMDSLSRNGAAVTLSDGEIIRVPKGEAPAYLEWAIWRAFLAINSLVNKPHLARRFQVDQDFFPVNTAPGRGPDMVFEFEHALIVVEVTLTSSSRQEAAEGEPVRRHVAQYIEDYGGRKEIYGLFIAVNIDSNTAHTFKYGDWYKADDAKVALNIVPMRLSDFRQFFLSGKEIMGKMMANNLIDLLVHCRALANNDAPEWKKRIQEQVQIKIDQLQNTRQDHSQ